MSFTADDATHVEFATAPIGRRGYAKHEVDDFVRRIAKTLAGEDDLTAAEVHHVEFGRPLIGKRGYDEKQVDEFLDAVEDELIQRSGMSRTAHQVPPARQEDQATASPRDLQESERR
ncbi:DivIVA domain-containing protein [Amycolatopsis arida]|uniref:Cell wall synthesis protein Wag31 n=1 Tax=Amycolatopsis arida TaxID=587909 RepID=A0A1I5Q2E7_9PSEU|nr:DivIVA domain-containing protein [Amycolatopsis arida]TDX98694.1 DivIVA domain-containing protein [Amycolatopsis arida]SFP40405.1 DivIVA domain-containing protein [Amycolatopsis arida]